MSQGHVKSAPILLSKISSGEVDPKELKPYQRVICLRSLLEDNPELSQSRMATILGTSRQWIGRFIKRINKHEGRIFSRIDPYEYAAELDRSTKARIKKLEIEKKWKDAAMLHMELTEKLMDLGMLVRAAVPIDMNLSVNGEIFFQEIVKLALAPTVISPEISETNGHKDEEIILGRTGSRMEGVGNN